MKLVSTRRRFVMGSTALLALSGISRSTFGQMTGGLKAPTVDSLVVKVLTDSSYDTPKPPASKLVKVRRAPFGSRTDFRKALHNEWGLALALESTIGADTRNLMPDFG
jgi:7,8-dihydropterin-6-yl-methyl-4-(beta-D-ribofuranosyl)aminobenzene 5'-phosphate synthase